MWAHRGLSSKFPENSLSAFRAALEAGHDGVELDIQKDADGQFRVIHDDTPARCCQLAGSPRDSGGEALLQRRISELSADDFQKLDCGDGNPPPLLQQVLDLAAEHAAGRKPAVNIELKAETLSPKDFTAIHRLLNTYHSDLFLLISSFRHELLVPFSRAGYRCGLLIGEEQRDGGLAGLRRSIAMVRPWSAHLPVQIYDQLQPAVRRALFAYLRFRGLKLIFWTVNRPGQYAMLPRRIEAVISDDPGVIAPGNASSMVSPKQVDTP
jgi:glycerophosphoryl diester phosphodiesterase